MLLFAHAAEQATAKPSAGLVFLAVTAVTLLIFWLVAGWLAKLDTDQPQPKEKS